MIGTMTSTVVIELIKYTVKKEGYSCIRQLFFPKKKYASRLVKITTDTTREFGEKCPIIEDINGKIPFYHSEILYKKLLEHKLFETKKVDFDELLDEFKRIPNIIEPTKEQIISFYNLFYSNLEKDKELKKLFIEENYKDKIFENSDKLDAISKELNISSSKLNFKTLNLGDFTNVEILKIDNYEKRYIKREEINYFTINEENETLEHFLQEKNRIVLLGNAGIGKTIELKCLFNSLWDKREEQQNFPFFITLKNFRGTSTFEDLIPLKEWRELPIITFILDGLDEIANIQDFISALEVFLDNNREYRINVVISCRTNIYEKYIAKIDNFEYVFLEGLSELQISNIFKRENGIPLPFNELNRFRSFLENSFNLNLFCDYYKEHKNFPNSQLEIWNISIEKELNLLNREKFKKRESINTPHIEYCLEKVAIVNELMQQNFISENDLYNLLGRDNEIFEEVSFIEKTPNSNIFTFRHKNYQEFFAAKYLANKNGKNILSFIKINSEINKTKPSLFNTIGFLLNILQKDKFENIKDWLLNNEPEILFLVEKDKLNVEQKNDIFKKHFTNIAIEKKHWFAGTQPFSMNKMAEFANIDFLMSVINKNIHFRTTISALNVLAFTECSDEDNDKIKNTLKAIILSNNQIQESLQIKSEALRTFREKEFYKDISFLKEIATYFKDNYSREIHHLIITILHKLEDIDNYFDILKNSLYKLYKIEPNREIDNVIRGTKEYFAQIALKIQNRNHFVEILKIIVDDNFDIRISEFYKCNFKEKFIKKILSFIISNKDISSIIDIFMQLDDCQLSNLYDPNNIFPTLVNEMSDQKINVFSYIIDKYGVTENNYMIITLFNDEKCIDYLVEKYKEKTIKISDDTLAIIRFYYSRHNYRSALYFDNHFSFLGHTFPNILYTEEEIEENNKKYIKASQENYDILFDRQKIEQRITKIFEDNDITKISVDIVHELEYESYRNNSYYGIRNSLYLLIIEVLNGDETKTKEEIISKLENEYYILYQIKSMIKDKDIPFEINHNHINYIKEACLSLENNFDYNNIISFDDENYYSSIYPNYNILEILYFFDKKYGVNYTRQFYLGTLRYCNIIGEMEDNIHFIESKVDKSNFRDKIIYNINHIKMDYGSFREHVRYVIKHKIEECYLKIEEAILNHDSSILKEYIEVLPKERKESFLTKCCTDINTYLFWEAIDSCMKEDINIDFILDKAKGYLKSNRIEFIANALSVLFYCNDPKALEFYITHLRVLKNKNIDLRDDYKINNKAILKYTNLSNIELLKEIFHIIYDGKIKENTFAYYNTRQDIQSLLISFSNKDFERINNLLKDIKKECVDSDAKTFHINHLIDVSNNSYLASLSKPLTFIEAEKLLYS